MSLLAGLSTGLGSSIVFFVEEIKRRHLSIMLGFSAGVIIYLSFVNLLLMSIETIGFIFANILFFTGIIVMALIDFIVPHKYATERLNKIKSKKFNKIVGTWIVVALGLAIHNFP